MRKRLLSVILAVVMTVGMIPLCTAPVSADGEELSELLEFNAGNIQPDGSYLYEGNCFRITAGYADGSKGIYAGSNAQWLTVEAIYPAVTITQVTAKILYWGGWYSAVGISGGRKLQNTAETGSIVDVVDINSGAFSFAGGTDYCAFGDITVYYTVAVHEHDFSVDCTDNGDGTHRGKCSACGIVGDAVHVSAYTDNGDGTHTYGCVCGFASSEKAAHSIAYTVNEDGTHTGTCVCGYSVTEAHEISYTDNEDGTHTASCKCGFETTAKHSIGIDATDNGDGTHSGKCICGYSAAAEAHEFSYTASDAAHEDGTHTMSCACGYTTTEKHRFFAPFTNNGDGTHTSTCVCGKTKTANHTFTIFTDNKNGAHTAECVCGYSENLPHERDESGVCICQIADHCEKLIYDTDNIRKGAYRYETDNFIITSNSTMTGYDFSGMMAGVGSSLYTLAITPKRDDIIITRVDARVVHAEQYYKEVGITRGRKLQTGGIECNSFVTVDEINANGFAFTGGTFWSVLSDMIVYYTFTNHVHEYGDFRDNGNGTHSRKCLYCDSYSVETEEHSFTLLPADNGDGTHTAACVCGLSAAMLHKFEDGVCFCGAESCSEKLVFDESCIREDGSYLYEGEHFRVFGDSADNIGIRGGNGEYWLTVEATDPKATITRVDAVTTDFGWDFDRNVGISRGRKFRNPGNDNGATVSVIEIDAAAFAYMNGYRDCKFGDITVYYTLADHNHELSDYTDNENGTHTSKCRICGVYGKTEKHSFIVCGDNLDGTHQSMCICGCISIEPHVFDGGDCTCGATENLKETLAFNAENILPDNSYLFESEHFRITSNYAYQDYGIYAGSSDYWMKVEATSPDVIITRVDAVCYYGYYFKYLDISRGRKFQEGEVDSGLTVNVLEINSDSVTFEGSGAYSYCEFGDITVYYTIADHEHDFSSFVINDDGTHSKECTLCNMVSEKEKHFFVFAPGDEDNGDGTHSGTCVCGLTGTEIHDFGDDNICVCGAQTEKEELVFNPHVVLSDYSYEFIGDFFEITAKYADEVGIYGGGSYYSITIEAKSPDVIITRVDAVVTDSGSYYDEVGISTGRKVQTGKVRSGSTVNVLGIDSNSFAFAGGTDGCYFGDITVYYTVCDHDFSVTDNGDGTHTVECSLCGKKTTEKHSITLNCTYYDEGTHTGQCDVCDAVTAGPHSFTLNCTDNGDGTHTGICACGISGTEEHVFNADGICACGAKIISEKLIYNMGYVRNDDTYLREGEFFRITADYADYCGVFGGSSYKQLRIAAIRPDVTITRIDAVVSCYGDYYDDAGISRGTKLQEGEVENGSTVSVLGIDSNSFAFAGGSDSSQFGDIIVYYRVEDHNHDFSVDLSCVDDCIHMGKCSVCGIIGEAEHFNTVSDLVDYGDGTHSYECVCDRSFAEPHIFRDGVCACGAESLFEKLVFNEQSIQSDNTYLYEGGQFRITASWADEDGVFGGINSFPLWIEATDPCVIINRVDAVVRFYGNDYDEAGVSEGRKIQGGKVENGSTVNVLDIDSNSFAFAGGSGYVAFGDIIVYYDIHEHSFEDFTDNGDGTYTAECECGEELTVTASYEYYFVNDSKPVAGGENGLVNKRAYYINDNDEKLELESGLLGEDLEVTFAQWYLRTSVQFKENEDGGVNVRFVSMLDKNLDEYYEAGFTYTVGGADSFDPLTTQMGNTSYIVDGKTVKVGDFGLGEEYFILRDVDFAKDAVDANLEITVTPYVLLTDGETCITGEPVTFSLGDLAETEDEEAA